MSLRRTLAFVLIAVCAALPPCWTSYQLGRSKIGPSPVEWSHPDDRTLASELAARFGPHHNSTHLEEWIVRDYFNDKRNGVFVDIGAWHWQQSSNTLALERDLGWSGLAVDAAAELAPEWAAHRTRSRFFVAFVDERDGGVRTLFLTDETSVASGDSSHVQLFGEQRRAVRVETRTLNTLLMSAGIKAIDYLTMDIELGEPGALRGFDIHRYRPQFICIEALPPVRQFILEYFARAGYVLVGKYHRLDPWNLYFEPLRNGSDLRRQP